MRAQTKARALIAGTIASGAGVVIAAALSVTGSASKTLALLAAAVVLTELFHVSDRDIALGEKGTHFSFSSSIHLASILLLGPWAGVLVGALGVLAVDPLRGARWRHVAFNASSFALAAGAGGAAYELAGGRPGSLSVLHDLPELGALALAYWLVNGLLVGSVVSLTARLPFSPVVRDYVRPELSTTAELGLGIAIAGFALTQPWAILALVPLLVAVYQAHERLTLIRGETARALETFANVVDERDPYTFQHSSRVAEYVRDLAQSLGLPAAEVARLRWAGRLHDLGKVAVDSAVLEKPGRLTDREWSAVRRHPRLSARLLRSFRFATDEARAVEYHHERVDGTGYYGLGADDVPLAAHFLIVADSFDAMTTDRPYRRALPREQALVRIEDNLGSQFHPAVGRAFVARQRGADPAAALSAEELAELRRALGHRSRRRPFGHGQKGGPEASVVVGIVGALVCLGLGAPQFALAGAAAAAAGLGWRVAGGLRARRLAARLQAACAGLPRAAAFDQAVARLSESADLRWAALVAWQEQELDGRIELERGVVSGPSESALTSWLLREAEEAGVEPLAALGQELGHEGVFLGLPLRRERALTGFLVLGFASRPSPHVRLAIQESAGPLASALAPPDRPTLPVLRPVAAVS
jgi:putative nucleotidyltransferase with HDIG domain